MLHILYIFEDKQFCRTNNFVGLQYFLAVFDLGLKLCMFERATRPFMDTHFDTFGPFSVKYGLFDRGPFLKLVGLGATAALMAQIQDGGNEK